MLVPERIACLRLLRGCIIIIRIFCCSHAEGPGDNNNNNNRLRVESEKCFKNNSFEISYAIFTSYWLLNIINLTSLMPISTIEIKVSYCVNHAHNLITWNRKMLFLVLYLVCGFILSQSSSLAVAICLVTVPEFGHLCFFGSISVISPKIVSFWSDPMIGHSSCHLKQWYTTSNNGMQLQYCVNHLNETLH